MTRQNGFAIRGFRQNAGISITQMAEIVDVSPAHYRKIEAETREARPEHLERIRKAVNQPVAALVRTPPNGNIEPLRGECAVCGQRDGHHAPGCAYGTVSVPAESVQA